jgi:hypothetical protein
MTNRRIPGGLEQFNGGRPPNEVGPGKPFPGDPTPSPTPTKVLIRKSKSLRAAAAHMAKCASATSMPSGPSTGPCPVWCLSNCVLGVRRLGGYRDCIAGRRDPISIRAAS